MLFSPTSSFAPSELVRTVGVLSDFMRFMVRLPHNEGLSLSELGVLRSLGSTDGMRISDLASNQEMTQPGMTQLVTRMARAGLVAREADPADRRAVRVVATPTGRRLFEERDASRVALFSALYERLEAEEKRRLHDALPVLVRLMELKEGLSSER